MSSELHKEYDEFKKKLDAYIKIINNWKFNKKDFEEDFKEELECQTYNIEYNGFYISAYVVLYKHYKKEYKELLNKFIENNKELNDEFEEFVKKTLSLIENMMEILTKTSNKLDMNKYSKLENIGEKLAKEINTDFSYEFNEVEIEPEMYETDFRCFDYEY